MTTATTEIQELANREYQWGFVTDVESDTVPRGLNEDIVRMISAKKNEPDFMLQWRLKAYPPLADHAGAALLGQRQLPGHRLPEHRLLLRPEAEEAS